jgi:DNA-directed RNA polymerase II subunit RPB2
MLPEIIQEHFPINVHCAELQTLHVITLQDVYYQKPTLVQDDGFLKEQSVKEAQETKTTYAFDVFVTVRHKIYSGTPAKFELRHIRDFHDLLLCKIPCLTESSVCSSSKNLQVPLRDPGMLIINGYEKVMITQEHIRPNFPFVSISKGKFTHSCEIRSFHPSKMRSTSTLNIHITNEKAGYVPEILILVPFSKITFPLAVAFRLFDVAKTEDMIELILGVNPSENFRQKTQSMLSHDMSNTSALQTPEELYDWVGMHIATAQQKQQNILAESKCDKDSDRQSHADKAQRKRIQAAKNIFHTEFFPHCGKDYSTPESTKKLNREKAIFLSYCVRKLIRVSLHEIPPDDIDNFINKRACSGGILFALLFRQLMRAFTKTLHAQIFKRTKKDNQLVDLKHLFAQSKITSTLKYACATGNWIAEKSKKNQSGVCQVINDTNIISKISHKRQVNTPINRDGKIAKPRLLHRTHLGPYCAAETPEGKSVGLVHQLALFARLRTPYPVATVVHILVSDLKVIPIHASSNFDKVTLVLVNGTIVGSVIDPHAFVVTFKQYRQDFTLPIDASVSYNNNELSVLTDAEDTFIPMIRVANLDKLPIIYNQYKEYLHLLWNQLLINGIIDYIDKEEELNVLYATRYEDLTPQHTHLQLDPAKLMFGASAGIIPFADRNQAPRNMYQASMGKQAVGTPSLGFEDHMQSKTHALNYSQQPIVTTSTAEMIYYPLENAGYNCITAIMINTGYNQEDSVLLNQGAVDLGLFRSTCFRTFREHEVRHGTDEERFCAPNSQESKQLKRKRVANLNKLEPNGLVAPGTHVQEHDIIAHKSMKISNTISHDASVTSKPNESCVVQSVTLYNTREDVRGARFVTASQRTPEMGDKFSSRHGQKGVCGMILPTVDMPYTNDGIVPDLILNIHAVPSRMTIAQLLESYLGKIGCIQGKLIDGSPFRFTDVAELSFDQVSKHSKEVMYNGKTGERLPNRVFIGVTYYQRLKHGYRILLFIYFRASLFLVFVCVFPVRLFFL